MTESLQKYLTQICQFFGFGFTIPMGQFLTNVFNGNNNSIGQFVFSFIALLIGVLAIIIGATLAMYQEIKELEDV